LQSSQVVASFNAPPRKPPHSPPLTSVTSWNNCGAKGQHGQLNMHGIGKRDGSFHFHRLQQQEIQQLLGISHFLSQFSVACSPADGQDWGFLRGFSEGDLRGFFGGECESGGPAASAINLFAINLRPAAMQAIATTEAENRNRIRNSNK